MCDRHDHSARHAGTPLGGVIQRMFGVPPEAAKDPGPQAAPLPVQPNRRQKLWELPDKLHCPVIGSCFTIDEIKKLAKQGGFAGKTFDEYRLHVEAVNISCSRNSLSERMHKWLDRKFDLHLKRFEKVRTDAAVRALWREHLDRGEVAGPMWAALTHRAVSPDTQNQVYADVHMLSHQVGAGQAADVRRLEWLEQEYGKLQAQQRQDAARHARELAEKTSRIQQLDAEAAEAWRRYQAANPYRQRLEALESGVAMTDMARALLSSRDAAERQQARAEQMQQRLVALEADLALLTEAHASVQRERDALEQLWLADADVQKDGSGCDGACNRCPDRLKGACVLCVGGRVALLPQYRQLAERLGVRLIHHDGGQEEALSRLPALLASSDAVICPTDCVGHLAYYQLKQHCKQAGKSCVLIKRSGVGSFAEALTRLAEGRTEINAESA